MPLQCTKKKRLKVFALVTLMMMLSVLYFLFMYHPNTTHHLSSLEHHGDGEDDDAAKRGLLLPSPTTTTGTSRNTVNDKRGDHRHHGQEAPIIITAARTSGELRATIILAGDHGQLVWKLFPDDAPKTVANFIKLAKNKIYDGTSLYRYEAGFCLQGGGWPKKSSPYGLIPLEYKLPNKKHMVMMARSGDPNSATMEFAIMLNDNSKWLGPGGSDKFGYAAFAEVIEGFDVMERLDRRSTRKAGLTYFTEPVGIQTVLISGGEVK